MLKPRQLPLLAIALLSALLAAATVQALTDVGSSASFPKACSAIASLGDVPAAAQRVTDDGGRTYVVGYRQVSGTNQNAIIAAFDSGGPDTRGYGPALDRQRPLRPLQRRWRRQRFRRHCWRLVTIVRR